MSLGVDQFLCCIHIQFLCAYLLFHWDESNDFYHVEICSYDPIDSMRYARSVVGLWKGEVETISVC